jgi:hypothetical protein
MCHLLNLVFYSLYDLHFVHPHFLFLFFRLNSQSIDGEEEYTPHTWEPVNDSSSPSPSTCRLLCRALLPPPASSPPVTRTLTAEDGTSCGSGGSLAVCIAGRCAPVGCDLEVASGRLLDRCGVCGGNGTSCGSGGGGRYRWERVRLSRCSASCGGGSRMVRHVCRDGRTGEEAADGLCPVRDKPRVQLDACNTDPCPPR